MQPHLFHCRAQIQEAIPNSGNRTIFQMSETFPICRSSPGQITEILHCRGRPGFVEHALCVCGILWSAWVADRIFM
ncbi:hypothetical protein PHET_00604 [Paragonimus heterotremus]|uniref:Uncharacterized protein n=1 Tax=Paragonimus heterotremus TaxID=100268 RepID=A0A8J4TNE7_9TREM|nr:hypothetical protein PHET_00604 [Paragonimus heterotremus]